MIGVTIWLIISVILLIVFVIVTIRLFIVGEKDYFGPDEVHIGLGFFGIIASVFSTGLSIGFLAHGNSHWEKKVHDILSVRNESGVEGSFCLGTGYVQDTQYYLYYYQADKGVRMGKVEADKTYIIETNACNPCLFNVKNKGEFYDFYELYVPEGTLILSYTIQ